MEGKEVKVIEINTKSIFIYSYAAFAIPIALQGNMLAAGVWAFCGVWSFVLHGVIARQHRHLSGAAKAFESLVHAVAKADKEPEDDTEDSK